MNTADSWRDLFRTEREAWDVVVAKRRLFQHSPEAMAANERVLLMAIATWKVAVSNLARKQPKG